MESMSIYFSKAGTDLLWLSKEDDDGVEGLAGVRAPPRLLRARPRSDSSRMMSVESGLGDGTAGTAGTGGTANDDLGDCAAAEGSAAKEDSLAGVDLLLVRPPASARAKAIAAGLSVDWRR